MSVKQEMTNAPVPLGILVLEDGQWFAGYSCGAPLPAVDHISSDYRGQGEVIFNTGMTGYPEVFTDISYRGQLLVMTYPHIGNYAVDPAWAEARRDDQPAAAHATDAPPIQIQALITRSLYCGAIPPGRIALSEYLKSAAVPLLSDVDTRSLTLLVRASGSLRGIVVAAPPTFQRWDTTLPADWLHTARAAVAQVPTLKGRDLVSDITGSSTASPARSARAPTSRRRVVLFNCGYKENIARMLRERDCDLTVVSAHSSAKELLSHAPHLVVLSNGPGDPDTLTQQVAMVQALIGQVPMFGICLGHQLLSLALGATTYKMKFGHHGINHPVRASDSAQLFVTSQNHEFAVAKDSLPADTEIWFWNANDHTVEGIRSQRHKVAAVQFHPEAAPGPHDTQWVFDYALDMAQ